MGAVLSKRNKELVNKNWGKLKCSPAGPLLQAIGVAPGNAIETSNQCQSNSFSTQFNASMTDQLNATNNLTKGLSQVHDTMNKFRSVIANIQQKLFNDLSKIATIIFSIYIKIGNIIMVLNKNLLNIFDVFKNLIDFGVGITVLLMTLMNVARIPLNLVVKLISLFKKLF
jgi:hypothetical protein